jgi:ADP-ribose diphosphatase
MIPKPAVQQSGPRREPRILELEFSSGIKTSFERLGGVAGGAVLIVPMLADDTVLLIREYAVGTERYELALPKGRIERNEDRLCAANRELMEEVGYGARKLTHLVSLSSAPGYSSAATHVVLAQDLYAKRLPGDEPKEIEVVPWRLGHLSRLLAREDFTEARSIAALYIVRDLLHGKEEREST